MKTTNFTKISLISTIVLLTLLLHSCTKEVTSGKIGMNLKWEFIKETGDLIISGNGPMPTFEDYLERDPYGGLSSYVEADQVKNVIIEEGVTTIGWTAFAGCGMTSLSIPNSVTYIAIRAFEYCRNLTSLTIPNSVTTMEELAFNGCSGLTNLQIGDNITIIHSEAFRRVNELTTVVLGDGITTIEWRAFSDNHKLSYVKLGRNITTLGSDAFSWAGTINEFTILNPIPPELDQTVFWGSKILTLYVPEESVELYKNSLWDKASGTIVGIALGE